MRIFGIGLLVLSVVWGATAYSDLILDRFDNDRSPANGEGTDTYWNPPPTPPFQVEIETQNVYAGTAALKVSWENKDLWPNFVIGKLNEAGNAGTQFINADSIRMAIAGPAGKIIMKMADKDGNTTGDLSNVTVSGSDEYQIYEFPYIDQAASSIVDLANIAEIWLLVDAGTKGSSGTIYIDSIDLIIGTGDGAEVIMEIDHFDNDQSLTDQAGVADSVISGNSLLPGAFTTTVVDDPTGANNAVLQVDYNTSPWQVLWVEQLDVTDWSEATEITIDVYGTAGGILLKLKDVNGDEQEPSGGMKRHDGNQWDTLSWGMESVGAVDIFNMGKLIVFIEGSTGGQGTIFFDNLTLVGVTELNHWSLY